jgi:hypothetical protein
MPAIRLFRDGLTAKASATSAARSVADFSPSDAVARRLTSASSSHGRPAIRPTACASKARAMQRHGHQHVRLLQQLGAGTRHVGRYRHRKLGAIRVLQRQDQPTPLFVIAQRGPRTVEHRWIGAATGTQPIGSAPCRSGERQAAPSAHGFGDESDLAEALGAQQSRFSDKCVACHALRRQQHVEHRTPRSPCDIPRSPGEISVWQRPHQHRTLPCRRA